MSKTGKISNIQIAYLFILLVVSLILVWFVIRVVFLFGDAKFDGSHRFIVSFISNAKTQIVSFTPQNHSISILNVDQKLKEDRIAKTLEVPVNGYINIDQPITNKNLSLTLFNSTLHPGLLKELNIIDSVRLFLFTRSVALTSIYNRDFSQSYSSEQKATLISLSFTDPSIYQENQSIQIINSSNIQGLGSRLATLINNIGGNVILVSSPQSSSSESVILYSKKNYTVSFLSTYLSYPIRKSDNNGLSDVIIVIGTDKSKSIKF